MLGNLNRDDRLRLMKFVCSFAWADLDVKEAERHFVSRLIDKLGLQGDREEILGWLRVPPPPEEVDPTRVSRGHRDLMLDAATKLFEADGEVGPEEAELLELLKQLLV